MRASVLAIVFALVISGPVQQASASVILGSTDQLNGHAVSSYADVGPGNQLNNVGFLLSGAAVRDPGTAGAMLFLTVPTEAGGTNLLNMELDWNPQGHEPPGVYDLPHFDFHFYYIPDSYRATIPGGVIADPGAQYRPAGYSAPGPTVPGMGGHSVDLTSPEFNGQAFTQTFIYGFYGGQEIFVEPMATQAYLNGLAASGSSSANFSIKQPGQYLLPTLPSLVPYTLHYSYDAETDQYAISVGDFAAATSVPEPASLVLVGISGAVLLAWRRKIRG